MNHGILYLESLDNGQKAVDREKYRKDEKETNSLIFDALKVKIKF